MTLRHDRPIVGVIGFNLFTLLVFVTAPVRWRTDNLILLCVFVLLCQFLVFLGFWFGRRTGGTMPGTYKPPFIDGRSLVRTLFIVYVITLPMSYAYRLELAPFDIPGIISRLVAGIRDPHFGYAATQEKTGLGPVPWSAFFLVSIFNQLFFPVGFLYWRQLRAAAKVVFVILLGIDLFYWIGIATSFGVVSLVTTFGLSTMFWPAHPRRTVRQRASRIVVLVLLLGGTIAFFSHNLYRRSNFVQVDVSQYEVARSEIILDHQAFALVPEPLWPTYIMVVTYLGQGYYHTCFAFDLEFRPTGLVGNNTALISLARLFGVDVWNDTYMHRLHRQGIDEYGVWHSAYTWFASDVSFFGVPVLLFVVGYLFGFSWGQGLTGDFLSRVVFIMFGNILLFLFANNTYLASVFYAFMVFVPLWMVTRFSAVGIAAGSGRRSELSRPTAAGPPPTNARVE